jgi:hypothetical protein
VTEGSEGGKINRRKVGRKGKKWAEGRGGRRRRRRGE